MILGTLLLMLQTEQRTKQEVSSLRGFITKRFPDYALLHQHDNEQGLIYTYPRVQYKIINSTPTILGIEEGTELLRRIYPQIDQLELGKSVYKVIEKTIIEREYEFGITKSLQKYKFLTPWLALNEENYKRYKSSSHLARSKLLEKILIGNIISMAKSLEHVITEEIKAKVKVKSVPVSLKGVPMLGFLGTFTVNFNLPDYIGLGKSVSRGFGTILRIRNNKEKEHRIK